MSETGSFRDPAGRVFEREGFIYRSIFQPGIADFEAARDRGIHSLLVKKGLMVSYDEVEDRHIAPEGALYCLQHPRLPLISYPWEWTFSMLKDAAILHLDIMEEIVPEGFWLRDASAFNVQYDGKRLVLIDTLSIGRREPESPWVAYGQFCAHFLAPLALAACCDIRMLSLWRNYIDGFPLDMAAAVLPFRKRFNPGLFMHLFLHARMQQKADKKEDIGKAERGKVARVSDRGLIGLIRSLRRTIKNLNWNRSSRVWDEYEDIRTYQPEEVRQKNDFVDMIVRRVNPETVWDLGANTGEFSLTAASHGAFVVSVDGDPACTEFLYQRINLKEHATKRILPLTMDLANPSPSLGWNSRERLSLRERGPATLVLALALIHHLVLSSYVPLAMVASWFADLAKYLVVEFVPPSDPMVQKLLRNRRGEHLPYNLETFHAGFERFFEFVSSKQLDNGRILFFCKRK